MRDTLDSLNERYLTFKLGEQLFGLPIEDVVQIIGIQKITPIPDLPAYVKGIIHLRGDVIPVIDVSQKFNRSEIIYRDRTCIIVVSVENMLFGLIVEEVDEVADIPLENVSVPPKIASDNQYLVGIGMLLNKLILLLNTSQLFRENDFMAIVEKGNHE